MKQHFRAGDVERGTSPVFPKVVRQRERRRISGAVFVPWNWMFDRKIWLAMHLNGLCHSLTRMQAFNFFFLSFSPSKPSFSKCYPDTRFAFPLFFLLLSLVYAAAVGRAECDSYFSSHIAPWPSPRADQLNRETARQVRNDS